MIRKPVRITRNDYGPPSVGHARPRPATRTQTDWPGDQFLLPRHAGDKPFLRGVIQADRHERVMSVVLHVDHGGPSRSVNRGVMEHQLPGLGGHAGKLARFVQVTLMTALRFA